MCGIDRNTCRSAGGTQQLPERRKRGARGSEHIGAAGDGAGDQGSPSARLPESAKRITKALWQKAHTKGVTSAGAVHVPRIMKYEACRRLKENSRWESLLLTRGEMMDMGEALRLKEECTRPRSTEVQLGFMDGTPLGYTGYMVELSTAIVPVFVPNRCWWTGNTHVWKEQGML